MGHAAHAGLAHGDVSGDEALQTLISGGGVGAGHDGQAVNHADHGVMDFVAVHGPVAFEVGDEVHGAGAAGGNLDGIADPTCGRLDDAALGMDDVPGEAVEVYGVGVHRDVGEADADALAEAGDERVGGGPGLAVEGEVVEVEHLDGIRSGGAGVESPLMEEDAEVAIGGILFGCFGMNDEEAHHAHGILDHFVVVGVVEVGAVLAEGEFVLEGFAGEDEALREAGDAVHAVGQEEAVPVDAGGFGEVVGDEDANAVAFDGLDGGAGGGAVVAPAIDDDAWEEFLTDGFCDEAKDLDAVVEFVGEGGPVGSDDGCVVGGGISRGRRSSVGGMRGFLRRSEGGNEETSVGAAGEECWKRESGGGKEEVAAGER